MELQTLFRWNYCSLCHTAMRTVRNAVDHYSSRAHDRRVSSWLVRQCVAQTNIAGLNAGVGVGQNGGIGFGLGVTSGIGPGGGGGSISVSGVGNGATAEVLRYLRTTRPADFYCDLCDLKLTSVMHAQQHFFGRRHRMVARNQTKPNGEGYYDPEGRWVRTDAKWLMCELCDVSITSESQMAMHMAGARHRRRVHTHYAGGGGGCGLSMSGMDFGSGYAGGSGAGSGGVTSFNGSHMYRVNANGTLVPLNQHEVPVFINQAPTSPSKTSATPTLQTATISVPNLCHLPPRPLNDQNAAYYCEACNVTLNHLKSVKQHEDGRLHRRNLQRMPGKAVILEWPLALVGIRGRHSEVDGCNGATCSHEREDKNRAKRGWCQRGTDLSPEWASLGKRLSPVTTGWPRCCAVFCLHFIFDLYPYFFICFLAVNEINTWKNPKKKVNPKNY